MTFFDPIYGELISAKETSESTGLTMNQLRNWRLPARLETAPFGYVSIGARPYYRKDSVSKWLETNSGTNIKYTPAGTDLDTPINSSFDGDQKHILAMRMLSNIQPENVNAVFERLLKQDNATVLRYANSYRRSLIKLEMPEWNPMERTINSDTRFQEPIWFPTMVKAMRMAQNELAGLGFTEEEVLALPIGEYPPLKETKG